MKQTRNIQVNKKSRALIRSGAKTKANLIEALPELIKVATNKSYKENLKVWH